jgi:hypothetical protein
MTEHEAQQRFQRHGKEWLGNFGEKLWARIFASSGIRYIPLHKIENGGAPMLEGGSNREILPDFECSADGVSVYMDSKVKTQSIIYRKMSQERHGINKRCWNGYQRTANASGKMCGLGIVELFRDGPSVTWSGSLLVETLTNLGEPIPGINGDRHKVYWPRKLFCDLDSFTACELVAIWRGEKQASYPTELMRIFSGKPPTQTFLW